MSTHITRLMRWKAWAACLAFMLLTVDVAKPAEQGTSDKYICAEREVLLETLVEAHGVICQMPARRNWQRGISLSCRQERPAATVASTTHCWSMTA